MILLICVLLIILMGFAGLAAYIFNRVTDYWSCIDMEKKKAKEEAEDKKKYPGSKPWI